MERFSQQDLNRLIGSGGAHCVSIFLPTHAGSEDGQQDLIRLKNLLREAEQGLHAQGVGAHYAEHLLKPGFDLLTDKQFWDNRRDGLALFFAPGRFHRWRLPTALESLCWVGQRFYLKPLFPLLDESGRYYLLAASQNHVRLFTCNRHEISEVSIEHMPHSLAEVILNASPEGNRQCRTGQPAFSGKEGVVFYGQGGAGDSFKKHELLDFFRAIDRGLHAVLKGQDAPLVFAGVEYLFPIYWQVNTYPHLLPEPIQTNPDRLNAATLAKMAGKLLEPYWLKRQHDDLRRFNEALGTSRVSANLEEVLQAAQAGRVESLFVAGDVQIWGRFDQSTGTVQINDAPKSCDEDLLDRVTILVQSHGGRVHVVPASDIPGALVVAALYRYAISHPDSVPAT
jgi:hypothetical protein